MMNPPRRDAAVPCYDRDCPGVAEPEQDGDHHYYTCIDCGFAFGWQLIRPTTADTCAAGIPEQVRRTASLTPPAPVLLQIGRPRDHAA